MVAPLESPTQKTSSTPYPSTAAMHFRRGAIAIAELV